MIVTGKAAAFDNVIVKTASVVPLLPSTMLTSLIETTEDAAVTVNEQSFVLPGASVAVQVTVVTPAAKKLPEGGLQTALAEQLSVTVGAG